MDALYIMWEEALTLTEWECEWQKCWNTVRSNLKGKTYEWEDFGTFEEHLAYNVMKKKRKSHLKWALQWNNVTHFRLHLRSMAKPEFFHSLMGSDVNVECITYSSGRNRINSMGDLYYIFWPKNYFYGRPIFPPFLPMLDENIACVFVPLDLLYFLFIYGCCRCLCIKQILYSIREHMLTFESY